MKDFTFENLTMYHYEHDDFSSLIFTTNYFASTVAYDISDSIMHSTVYPVYKQDISISAGDFLSAYIRSHHILSVILVFNSTPNQFNIASQLASFVRTLNDVFIPVVGITGLSIYEPSENSVSFSNRISEIAPKFDALIVSEQLRHNSELSMYSDMLTTILSILDYDNEPFSFCNGEVFQFESKVLQLSDDYSDIQFSLEEKIAVSSKIACSIIPPGNSLRLASPRLFGQLKAFMDNLCSRMDSTAKSYFSLEKIMTPFYNDFTVNLLISESPVKIETKGKGK